MSVDADPPIEDWEQAEREALGGAVVAEGERPGRSGSGQPCLQRAAAAAHSPGRLSRSAAARAAAAASAASVRTISAAGASRASRCA